MNKKAKALEAMVADQKALDRFWSRVDVRGDDECWDWQGCKQYKGYGTFGYKDSSFVAHRISHTIANGNIPPGLFVCHKCDRPCCVNPNHLWLGTIQENNLDAQKKGRAVIYRNSRHFRGGTLHSNAKLNPEKVIQIRELLKSGVKPMDIAVMFGVTRDTIYNVRSGVLWSYV